MDIYMLIRNGIPLIYIYAYSGTYGGFSWIVKKQRVKIELIKVNNDLTPICTKGNFYPSDQIKISVN